MKALKDSLGIRPLLLGLALAAMLFGACRQSTEQPAAVTEETSTAALAHAGSQKRANAATTVPHPEPEGIHLSDAARTNLNLQIDEVTIRPIEKTLKVPGVVKAHPDRLAYVTPHITARVEKVYVNVGDTVQRGAPLLDLRSVEVERLQVELLRAVKTLRIVEQSYARTKELTEKTVLTQLEALQQELIQAHGAMLLAASSVERTQQLSDKVVARKELLAAKTEHQHARSAYDAAQRRLHTYGITEAQIRTIIEEGHHRPVLMNLGLSAEAAVQKYLILSNPGDLFAMEAQYREKRVEVESLKRQLELVGFSTDDIAVIIRRGTPNTTFTLTAPISGIVSARQAIPGAVVDPSEKLVEIMDTSVVWIEGDLAENLLATVKARQTARARVAAYPEEVFIGMVRTIGRTVEADKRTVHLWVEVANPEGKLLPEMFADVHIVTQASVEAMTVPRQAIISDGAEKFVFVENGDTYAKLNVVVGLEDDRYVEIRDGLFPGDRVVSRGGYELHAAQALSAQQTRGGDGHTGHAH